MRDSFGGWFLICRRNCASIGRYRREWELLSERAGLLLDDTPRFEGRFIVGVRRTSAHPGWGGTDSYDLFASHDEAEPRSVLLRQRWDEEADALKLATPEERARHPEAEELEPAIVIERYDVAAAMGARIERAVRRARVSVHVEEPAYGMDGSYVTLRIGKGWASCHFVWWEDAPKEWKAVGRIEAWVMREVRRAGWD